MYKPNESVFLRTEHGLVSVRVVMGIAPILGDVVSYTVRTTSGEFKDVTQDDLVG